MRDGLFEMVRDAANGNGTAEYFVGMAEALLLEAAELALTQCSLKATNTGGLPNVETIIKTRNYSSQTTSAAGGRQAATGC